MWHRKRILVALVLFFFLAVETSVHAIAAETPSHNEINLRLLTTYRSDNFDWNIAGDFNGENPNVLSELAWKDLKIWQLQLDVNIDIANEGFTWFNTFLKVSAGYGWIVEGHNLDSDYTADNRSDEVSRSINDADDGSVIDLSIAIGPHFNSSDGRWSLIPLLGYSWHEQRLALTNGRLIVPPSGPFDGLDSTYETEWSGPWVGFDLAYVPIRKWTFTTNFEYHWADYSAEADWNMRDDFQHPKSFEHKADGDGWVAGVGVNYALSEKFSVGLSGEYLSWETDPGRDRLYLANESTIETRLNEVNWKSTSLSVNLDWAF